MVTPHPFLSLASMEPQGQRLDAKPKILSVFTCCNSKSTQYLTELMFLKSKAAFALEFIIYLN